jgi:HAMP domain-containing protein
MDRAEVLAGLHEELAWVGGLVLLLCAAIGLATVRFARALGRPLAELADAARGIAAGDYRIQVPVRSGDEVGTLAASFNSMASRVATAHAGLQENVRELQQEIQRRRRVESEREALIAELTGAMAEIRTLEGIIPICASCKKIRDDHGYWNQLETYIADHSRAHFSHGLCPDCLARYEQDMDLGNRQLDPSAAPRRGPEADAERHPGDDPADAPDSPPDPPPDPRWPRG